MYYRIVYVAWQNVDGNGGKNGEPKKGRKKFSMAHTGKSSFSTITSQRVRESEENSICWCSGAFKYKLKNGKRGHMIEEELIGLLFI